MFDRIYSQRKYTNLDILANKIKLFFKTYSINRHKMAVMTPIFHFNP
jgi:hypothetical protein